MAAIEAVPRIEPPSKAEPPVDPVAPLGGPVRTNGGHAVRWRICLGIVGILGIIGAGGRWVTVERIAELTRQQAAAAEKAHDEEQARQAAAKSQVEDALKNGKAEALDSKVFAEAMPLLRMAADQRNADAQLHMGLFYKHGWACYRTTPRRCAGSVNGFGVPRDPEQASLWFSKARGG